MLTKIHELSNTLRLSKGKRNDENESTLYNKNVFIIYT